MILNKYTNSGHEKCINNLKILINNYELNYKAIYNYLLRRRKECQEYYLLSDEDLLLLIEYKDNNEIREKLLLKIYPFIKSIYPGKESDDNFTIITKYDNEKINLKYIKITRTLKDGIECIEQGITKKIKEQLKSFKKIFDNSLRPKIGKNPKEVMLNLLETKDMMIYQLYFICIYHLFYHFLEKTLEKENSAFDKMFDYYNLCKDEWKTIFINMIKSGNNSYIKNKILISIIAICDYIMNCLENLIREDIGKTTDFGFSKVLQIKIENDSTNIRLLNINYEYGNEYTGLNQDFIIMPQTEKTLISLINAMSTHKSFVFYNNQAFFKKEISKILTHILGRDTLYFPSNEEFNITGLNNLMFGNMKRGFFVCIENIEIIKTNLLQILIDRIIEISLLIKSKGEEGIFTDRDGEKYLINTKNFNIFMTYNIDNFHLKNKNYLIPYSIKSNFRVIGLNYIDYLSYIILLFHCYCINKAEEISSKIFFILQNLIYKNKNNLLNKKNLQENIIPLLFNNIKKNILEKINIINKKNIYQIVKDSLFKIILPFIQENYEEKEDFESLINIILFDYEEKEKNLLNKINKKNLKIEFNEYKKGIDNNKIDEIYNIFISKFNFRNNAYKVKIKTIYDLLSTNQSLIILGPTLTGKTNILVLLRDISIKLNEINKNDYPIFNYVKIFHNYKDYHYTFLNNDKKFCYQINNIFFKNIIEFLDNDENLIKELDDHYKIMSMAPGEEIPKNSKILNEIKIKAIKENEDKSNNNTNDSNTLRDKVIKQEKDKKLVKNEDEQEGKSLGIKRKMYKLKNKSENYDKNNENKEDLNINKNEYNAIVFDGSISIFWYNYLINYFNENNFYTLHDSDILDLSNKKIIYETSSLSMASPSFITKKAFICFDYDSLSWLNICYAFVDSNFKIKNN